ncbi:MAG: ABC transporter ATP-binding protein, partial [Gemmatimonadota bacterium]|nr:ABC transporter ATP-binding protein [Gemmatimonadota bacterium]
MTRREPPLLAGSGLRKTYGDRVVVDVERIEIFPGELVSVFGPNGAGKSTLLRLLAMLEEPTAGRVEFRGSTGRSAERAMRASSAVVFQRPHIRRETVAYNDGQGQKLRGVPRV